MKTKVLALAALALSAVGASAQMSVVKEGERLLKAKPTFAQVEQLMTPAFSNPETSGLAVTYYVPGKAAFTEFDNMLVLRELGQLDDAGQLTMSKNLLEGLKYFKKALPLDSLPDEKGKIKPKYSKDIVNQIAGHYVDYNRAAVDFWNHQDYKGAYEAWGVLVELPKNETFAKAIGARAFADSTLSDFAFNQGLAAWQTQDYDLALAAFDKARSMGYNKKQLYDYAVGVATQAGNHPMIVKWAEAAMPLYGAEDDTYIRQIINVQLQDGKTDEALSSINSAIASDPNNSQLYWVLGIIYDYQMQQLREQAETPDKKDPKYAKSYELRDQAEQAYTKARQLKADNAGAILGLAQIALDKANDISDAAPAGASEAYFKANIAPAYLDAADMFEEVVKIDPENRNALQNLRNIYYQLRDNANYERVDALLNQ